MRPLPYAIGFFRVLFSLGVIGWITFGLTVALGIGWYADYVPIRAHLNPIFKAWVGTDMPPSLPWMFIAAAFVLIALARLVHRHVIWEAVLPRLVFSQARSVRTILQSTGLNGPQYFNEPITIGYVEISNVPRSRVGGLAAEKAWGRAVFKNLTTGEIIEVRNCRWTENPKPRPDEHMTTMPVRFNSDWNVRTLDANGASNRLDFCIRHENEAYGFQASSQENDGWRNDSHLLWPGIPIEVTICIEARNLESPASCSFKIEFTGTGDLSFLD
jgi:hypothetical protein